MDDNSGKWNTDDGMLYIEDADLRSKLRMAGPQRPPDNIAAASLDPEAVSDAVMEKSPLLIYMMHLDGATALMNRKMRDVTGLDSVACPTGESLLEALYPDSGYRKIVRVIHDGWQENRHVRDQITLVATKKRGVRNISWSTSRLKAGRSTLGYMAMGVDVTEHKRVDQWARLQSGVLESLHDGVVICDHQGQVMSITGAANRMLGRTTETTEGKQVDELFTDESRVTFLLQLDKHLARRGTVTEETEMLHADGREVAADVTAMMLKNEHGQPIAKLFLFREPEEDSFVGQMQDLGAITTSFERKVAQLTEEVERRNKEIEKRNKEIEKRYREIAERDAAIKGRDEEIARIQESTKGAQDEIQRRDLELDAQARALELHAQALAERDQAIIERDQIIQRGHDEVGGLRKELETAKSGGSEQAAQAAQLQDRIAQLDASLRDMTEDRDRLAADAERINDELTTKTTELQQVTGDAEGLAKGLREARAEANKRLATLESSHEEALASLRGQLGSEAGEERNAIEEAFESQRNEMESLLDKASTEVDEARETAKKEAKEAITKARKERDTEVARVRKEMESRVQKLTSNLVARVGELEAEIEEVEGDAGEEVEKFKVQWEEERAKLKADLEKVEEERMKALKELRDQAEQEKVDVTSEEVEEVEELKQKLEDAENARVDAIAEVVTEKEQAAGALRAQIKQLEKRIDRREEDIELRLRAEIEDELTKARNEAFALKDQLRRAVQAGEDHARSAGALAADLGRISETAIIVCGTDGRVLTWSEGAQFLDGRGKEEAVGKLLHGDVMQVDGFDWRQIVAKMAMGKRITVPVSVTRTDGLNVPAMLEAVGIKDDMGRPAGFIEILRELSAVAKMEQQLYQDRAMAVIGELTASIQAPLVGSGGELVKQGRRLTEWGEELLRMMMLYREGGKAAEIEELLRETDLQQIADDLPGLAVSMREHHQRLWNTGRDLERYINGLEMADEDRYSVTQAVETAVHLVLGPQPDIMVEREYADVPPLLGRGRLFFPLLIQLLRAAQEGQPAQQRGREINVRTGRDEDFVVIEVSHPGALFTVAEADELQHNYRVAKNPGTGPGGLPFAIYLAKQAGGSLEIDLGELGRTTYRVMVPIDPNRVVEDSDEDSLEKFLRIQHQQHEQRDLADVKGESVGVRTADVSEEVMAEASAAASEIIEAIEEEVEAAGATGEVEEYDRAVNAPAVATEEMVEAPASIYTGTTAPANKGKELAKADGDAEETTLDEPVPNPREEQGDEATLGDEMLEELPAVPPELREREADEAETASPLQTDEDAANAYEAAIAEAEADMDGMSSDGEEEPTPEEEKTKKKTKKKAKKKAKKKK